MILRLDLVGGDLLKGHSATAVAEAILQSLEEDSTFKIKPNLRFVHGKTLNIIEVIITAGERRQIVARDESGVYSVGRKQSVAGHQVIGGLKDGGAKGKDSQKGEQRKGLMKVHFLQHRTVTLEIAQHPLRSNLFVFDDPTAEINEQSFRSNDRRSKSRYGTGFYSLEKVAARTLVKLILKQVVDENVGINENA
jgi:hypothetical protein